MAHVWVRGQLVGAVPLLPPCESWVAKLYGKHLYPPSPCASLRCGIPNSCLTRFGILAFLFNWNICSFVCVSFLPPFNDIYSVGCDVTVPLSRLLRLNEVVGISGVVSQVLHYKGAFSLS